MASSPFSPTSRYYGLSLGAVVDARGQTRVYVQRRFIPAKSTFAALTTHVVVSKERYDTIAAAFLGDPLQFWRLADGAGVMDPCDLEAPGRVVAITLPAGVPGYPSD